MSEPRIPVKQDTTTLTSRAYSILAALIIAIGLFTAGSSIAQKSFTVDESVHLAAGYSYWTTGEFIMNPEHPPFVKEVAAIPLLFMDLESKTDGEYFSTEYLWEFGPDFMFNNTKDSKDILFAARIMQLTFLALLGLIVFRWSKELFGERAALASLFFTMFSPTILAHSRLVTTDIAMTFATVFLFYTATTWLKNRTIPNFFWFTFAIGVVSLTKYTAVVMVVTLLIVLFVHAFFHGERSILPLKTGKIKKIVRRTWDVIRDFMRMKFFPLLLSAVMVLSLIVLVFDFDVRHAYDGLDTKNTIEDFAGTTLSNYKPTIDWVGNNAPFAGYYYWEGLVSVLTHNKGGHDSFILGEASNEGWWYYFPVLMLFKASLVTLVLLVSVLSLAISSAVLPFFRASSHRIRSTWNHTKSVDFAKVTIFLVPLIFMGFSMTSNLNLGIRHVLPVFPFIFIGAGALFVHLVRRWWGATLLVVTMAYSAFLVIQIHPNYIPYFNPLSGGSEKAIYIAGDSNLDWGQGLKQLKRYMDENAIDRIALAYFGTDRPENYGIAAEWPPSTQDIKDGKKLRGYVAVSASWLVDPGDDLLWITTQKPIARVGESIYVYYID